MKNYILWMLSLILLVCGCNMQGPDERAVGEMLETFIAAVERGDEVLARACLMDMDGFHDLNPDAAARLDTESFSESIMAELVHHYRDMVDYFNHRELKLKSFTLGVPWYQYKGRQAFKDTEVIISANDETVIFDVKGIVRINNQWRIVDLSGNEYF